MKQSGQRGGFTLVELMVVISIIAIISGVMVAEMRGTFEQALLKTTAQKIIQACDAANNRAISVRQPQLLKVDSKEGHFAIQPKNPPEEEQPKGDLNLDGPGQLDTRIALTIREPNSDEAIGEEALPPSEERERRAQADVITFYPDGTCDPREFLLRDRAGFELALRINPITSRVRILETTAQSRP